MSAETTPSLAIGGPRRLAAILAADIVGYSRLMSADEEGTLSRMKRLRREVIDPTLQEHYGRLIKTTGDGFLAMFDSPLEAVRCAIVIQQSLAARNTATPQDQRIQYRIGVNLGDVIVDQDDIYGEGVNIAARLETLAEPGGVYISGGVYEQIKNKLVCGYQSLGDEKLKNITDPVRVYRVLPDPAAVSNATRHRGRWAVLAAALVLALAVGGWFAVTVLGPEAGTVAQAPVAAPAQASTQPAPQAAPPASGASPAGLPPPPAPLAEALPIPIPPMPAAPAGPDAAPAPGPAQQTAILVPAPSGLSGAGVSGAGPSGDVGRIFRDCQQCPEMVRLPGGTFRMGSDDDPTEKPVHVVRVGSFALGRTPVTVNEWNQCAAAKGCALILQGDPAGPARNLSWNDARQYVEWLSKSTGRPYRLPSEAEWEFAARAGTTRRYWWGDRLTPRMANCKGCGEPYDQRQPAKVASFTANAFGLFDMAGGVAQWVADCWAPDYQGAPGDGSARTAPNCRENVLRGGSWRNDSSYVRAASRAYYDTNVRYPAHGLRVARSP
ncbi:MAG: SUMF1/EgtB/PvdO family nonheme iron enzyme [Microvirga sp.]